MICLSLECQAYSLFRNSELNSDSVYKELDWIYSCLSTQYAYDNDANANIYQRIAIVDVFSGYIYGLNKEPEEALNLEKCKFDRKIGVYQVMLKSSEKYTHKMILIKEDDSWVIYKQDRNSIRHIFARIYNLYRENPNDFSYNAFLKCMEVVLFGYAYEKKEKDDRKIYLQTKNFEFYFPMNSNKYGQKISLENSVYDVLDKFYAEYVNDKNYRWYKINGLSKFEAIDICDLITLEYYGAFFDETKKLKLKKCRFEKDIGIYISLPFWVSSGAGGMVLIIKEKNTFKFFEKQWAYFGEIFREIYELQKNYPSLITQECLNNCFDYILYGLPFECRHYGYNGRVCFKRGKFGYGFPIKDE